MNELLKLRKRFYTGKLTKEDLEQVIISKGKTE